MPWNTLLVALSALLLFGCGTRSETIALRETATPWLIGEPDFVPDLHGKPTLADIYSYLHEAAAMRRTLPKDAEKRLRVGKYFPPLHKATISGHGQTYMLATVRMHPALDSYDLLFQNDELVAVLSPGLIDAPSSDVLTAWINLEELAGRSQFEQQLLTHFTSPPSLSRDKFFASVSEQIRQWRRAQGMLEPSPFLAIFRDGGKKHHREHLRLMQKFNGARLELGQDVQMVEAILGESRHQMAPEHNSEVRIYGSDAEIGWYPVPTVWVFYKNGVVEAVFTTYHNAY